MQSKSDIEIAFQFQDTQSRENAIHAMMARDSNLIEIDQFRVKLKNVYYAETLGDAVTTTCDLDVSLPCLKQTDAWKDALKAEFQLTEEDIGLTDSTYKDYLESLINNILTNYQANDLSDPIMINKAWLNKSKLLAADYPKYADHHTEDQHKINEHCTACMDLALDYLENLDCFEMYVLIAANIKIIRQYQNVIEYLKTKQIESTLDINGTNKINRLKREAQLLYAADKKNSVVERAIYKLPSQAVNEAVKNSYMSKFEHQFSHTYSASFSVNNGNTTITYNHKAQTHYSVSLPYIEQTTSMKTLLQKTDPLLGEEKNLERVESEFKRHVMSFSEQIPKIKKPDLLNLIFSSHKTIETDLLFLLDANHDSEFIPSVEQLKNDQPAYYSFERDIERHSKLVAKFQEHYWRNEDILKNLFRIYFHIASVQKQSQTHWIFQRETYADLARNILKIPLLIALFIVISGIVLAFFLFLMFPFIILPASSMSLNAAAMTMLAWTGTLITGYYHFRTALKVIENATSYLLSQMAKGIDWIINTLFCVKPHATELGYLLQQVHDKGAARQWKGWQFFSDATDCAPNDIEDQLELAEGASLR